jgi:predicted XRE-type DNA-binding protein
MVRTMKELDSYPWSGHGVLVGMRKADWQNKSEVLSRFGEKDSVAVEGYRKFVADGWGMGRREDLMGGGLRRSAGGWEELVKMGRNKEYQRGDERILGDGDFVSAVLEEMDENLVERESLARAGWTWERVVQKVCRLTGVSPEDLGRKGRNNVISQAKAMVVRVGIKNLGMRQKEIAEKLGVSQAALSQIYQGSSDEEIKDILLS